MTGLGLDLDGVLADYQAGRETLGLPDLQGVFGKIKNSPDFWEKLPHYPETPSALTRLRDVDRLVFFTKRYGLTCRQQTARWLQQWIPDPTVLIVTKDTDKGRLAGVLGLEAIIDDREDAFLFAPREVGGFLIDREWNQGADLPRRVQRVASIEHALDALDALHL